MDNSKINVRYARALFLSGKSSGQVADLYDDIVKIHNLCGQSPDFISFLENPVIRISHKKTILRELLHSQVSGLTMRFIQLVADHQRERMLPGICRHFIDLVKKERGIVTATLTTAGEVSGELLGRIRADLETETGKTVELTGKTDPSIIGGMIIRIEDLQYDGSIATQLKKIREVISGQ